MVTKFIVEKTTCFGAKTRNHGLEHNNCDLSDNSRTRAERIWISSYASFEQRIRTCFISGSENLFT